MSEGVHLNICVLRTVNANPKSLGNPKPLQRHPVPRSSNADRDAEVRQKKKCSVQLNDKGWVVANCEGSRGWLADLRQLVHRWLDVSTVKFAQQDPGAWSTVIDSLARDWEYVGHPHGIARQCLEKHANVVLKNDRHKLADIWKKGGCNPRMPAPPICDALHWSKLINHFQSDYYKKASEKAVLARGEVKNPNLMGRSGNSAIFEKLVS